MNEVQSRVLSFVSLFSTKKIAIGLSGGIDSIVLLYVLNELKAQHDFELIAIHINHHLEKNANDWALFCEDFSKKHHIKCITIDLDDQPKKGESIEAWARKKRYQAFERILKEINCTYLYLGHHKNDQAETFLLNLMRGSGLAGLSAMSELRKVNGYRIVRPFLTISKNKIKDYAKAHQLQWIDDPSNDNQRFDRNFIRHEILDPLNERFDAINNITQSALFCQEANQLLESYLSLELNQILNNNSQIIYSKLQAFDDTKQVYLLRLWLKQQNIRSPNRREILELIRSLKTAQNNWQFNFNDYVLILYDDLLRFYKNTPPLPDDFLIHWHGEPIYLKKYGFSITQDDLIKLGIDIEKIDWHKVIIRARKPQDKYTPIGKKKANTLKNIFQQKRIPKWIRQRTPIIEHNGEIIAVGKLF